MAINFLTAGTHTIDETFFDKIAFCDCNQVGGQGPAGITVVLKTDLGDGFGVVRFCRLEENGNDNANYVRIQADTGKIGNRDFYTLPIEDDWLEIAYHNGKWRCCGGGQAVPKGPGGQHRTATGSALPSAWYRIHEGDRGAVIRCVLDVPAMGVVLPDNATIGRTTDYAATFRVGVMITRNHLPAHPERHVNVITKTGYSIAGQPNYHIPGNKPDLIHWFELDGGTQWFVAGLHTNSGYSSP